MYFGSDAASLKCFFRDGAFRGFLWIPRILTELRSEKFEWFGPSPIEPFNLGPYRATTHSLCEGFWKESRPCVWTEPLGFQSQSTACKYGQFKQAFETFCQMDARVYETALSTCKQGCLGVQSRLVTQSFECPFRVAKENYCRKSAYFAAFARDVQKS